MENKSIVKLYEKKVLFSTIHKTTHFLFTQNIFSISTEITEYTKEDIEKERKMKKYEEEMRKNIIPHALAGGIPIPLIRQQQQEEEEETEFNDGHYI